ncbi:hypothetical protein ID866_338 [Astraeus odoratus]|nr:hypothetical protein ID866_338 [Astraeus odoratus]
MDVDEPNAVAGWLKFFTGPDFPWSEHEASKIEARRARMTDVLMFDVLLIRGGISQPDMYYPPVDTSSLRRLLRAIDSSTYDILKKDCLVYILLKWYQDNREVRFEESRSIPPQFVALADAYWHLDTGVHVAKAVSILSDARLNRDYVSKILHTLSLEDHASALIVKYIRTAKPLLTEPSDIDLYTVSLADLSFMDAWQYQRTFAESSPTRKRLLQRLFWWCLYPAPRSEPLSQLIGFSLTPFEQSLLTTYALDPPSSLPPHAVTALQELVCVRLIQSADYVGAIKLDRQFTAASGSSASKERRQLMDEIISILPPAERSLLEVELGQVATGVRAPATPSFISERRESGRLRAPLGDLSMSWEELQVHRNSPSASAVMSGRPTLGSRSPVSSTPSRVDLGSSTSSKAVDGSIRQNFFTSASPAGKLSQSIAQHFAVLAPRQSASAAPRVGPSGITLPATRDSTAQVNRPQTSLFEKSGSAKHAPNAFYKPPASQPRTSIGTPSTVPTALSTFLKADTNVSDAKPAGGDISMGSEEAASESEARNGSDDATEHLICPNESDMTVLHADTDEDPGLGFSVFGGAARTSQEQKDGSSGSGAIRYASDATSSPPLSPPDLLQEKRRRAPPGAFHTAEEESDEGPPSPRRSTRTRSRQGLGHYMSPSPPRKRKRAMQASKSMQLSQSIPGSLVDEDEEHDEGSVKHEEEDDVAPLPPSRPGRKTRTVASASKAKSSKAIPQPKTPPRRSSRLSTASLSPDGPDSSPPVPVKSHTAKPRKSTRTSTAGTNTVATRSTTRRKR